MITIKPIDTTRAVSQVNHLDRIDPVLAQEVADAGRYLVATDRETVVGILKWSYFQSHIPYCENLQVLPAYQGQGIGKQLMQTRHDHMTDKGYTHTMISTTPSNTIIQWYVRLGYQQVGKVDLRSAISWEDEVEVFLIKKL